MGPGAAVARRPQRTQYNKYHFHDLSLDKVRVLFSEYRLERHFNWEHEFDVCFFTLS